jgi:hypothetical protein
VLDSVLSDLTSPHLRARAIAIVASDVNIARRNWNAYPPGHPLITSSLQKLMESLRVLCQCGSVVRIGITRDGLLLEDEFVEKSNQICKNVATVLFDRGIGALFVLQPPSREELLALLGLLALKREEVFAQGGIEKLWQEAGITALEVRGIRYDRFSGTEEEHLQQDDEAEESLDSHWEQFVRLLMKGDVGLSGTDAHGDVRPEVLAATLNAHFGRRMGVGSGLSNNALRSVTTAIQQILAVSVSEGSGTGTTAEGGGDDQSDWSDLSSTEPLPVKADLAAFIAALDPVLRRQILNGFCEVSPADEAVSTELFRYLGSAALQDTYASAEEYAAAPPLLQEILKKLLPHLVDSYETSATDDEIRTKMQTLLQEHQREAYMPDEYMQGLLDTLHSDLLKQVESAELAGLLNTLSPQFIDSRGSEIIMQLVLADPDGETAQELILNLAELCGHFLELGDYGQVLKILSQAADPRLPQPLRSAMRNAFCQREFLDEILSGLTIWGKPKYDQVALLIQILGRVFIDPLLDRMAEEENMSLRRFMMDRVQSFGSTARPYLMARLADSRWYVLRNIIIMLRALGPAPENEQLRPLLRHSNQKVRHEVLKSLVMFNDPMAQRQVLRDLDSPDRETQLIAINMADRNSTPEMGRKLLLLVNSGGYSAVECELKSAAVHALAEINRPEILPELARILSARSLLAYKALSRLKLDVVRSLERYPVSAVLPLLERLSVGHDDVALQAAESLRNLRSKTL